MPYELRKDGTETKENVLANNGVADKSTGETCCRTQGQSIGEEENDHEPLYHQVETLLKVTHAIK
jgi:hypothetical protein